MKTYARASARDTHEIVLRIIATICVSIVTAWVALLANTTEPIHGLRIGSAAGLSLALCFVLWLGAPLILRAAGWRNLKYPKEFWLRGAVVAVYPLAFLLLVSSHVVPRLFVTVSTAATVILLAAGFALERSVELSPQELAAINRGRPIGQDAIRVGKAFGFLSILFGVSVLVVALIVMLGGLLLWLSALHVRQHGPPNTATIDITSVIGPMTDMYRGVSIASAIIVVTSSLLIGIGIGQTRNREWARRWSIFWSRTSFAAIGVMISIWWVVIAPAYGEISKVLTPVARARQAQATPFLEAFGSLSVTSMAVWALIIFGPYPLLMLFFFSRRGARGADRIEVQ